MGVVTALATAAAIASITPAQASTGHLYVWITDGWGGGTVTSQPAGINCHTTAWDPYADDPQPSLTGPCDASFEVGTTVTLTVTPDPGSSLNIGPEHNPLTIYAGYNPAYAIFCPNEGLCMPY
jgi:hypothetical protein